MPGPLADAPAPTAPSRTRRRTVLVCLVIALLGLSGVLTWRLSRKRAPAPLAPGDAFALPTVSSSPYRNTTAEAHYVGSGKCTHCHEAETESYRETGMGRSMAPVPPGGTPADGSVVHSSSARRYEVYRKDGVMHHREWLHRPGNEDVLLADVPMKYVIGSGRHSLTYAAEVDGFLVESPVTWYTARKSWDMSPGFDRPDQAGFQRPVEEVCLSCHAGRAEAVEGSLHRIRFHELTIGCERCHGPGSLHLERQNHPGREEKPAGGPPDDTIVNPKRLPRPLAEAVCEQCHLFSPLMVPVRGRRLDDFRPGLPLEDFRLDYHVVEPDEAMKVTGHVEQLHASACYQKSADLTCLTCHNPHGFPKPEERVGYYRAICQNCHEHRKPCTDPAARETKNGCVKCHMPTGPTDIPHLAFTHHRIGFHPDRRHPVSAAPAVGSPGYLQPYHDLSRLGDLDRKRSLGMAYLELSGMQSDPATRQVLLRRGFDLVTEVQKAGLSDALVDCTLCRLSRGQESVAIITAARRALAHPDLTVVDRCDVLFMLAEAYFQERQYRDAIEVLEELNRRRRGLPGWLLLAGCQEALGNRAEMAQALEYAVTINPTQPEARRRLAQYCEQKGDHERAEFHRRRMGTGQGP